jgi:hypothetical protein
MYFQFTIEDFHKDDVISQVEIGSEDVIPPDKDVYEQKTQTSTAEKKDFPKDISMEIGSEINIPNKEACSKDAFEIPSPNPKDSVAEFDNDPRIIKLYKINADICDLENQIIMMNGNKESKEYCALNENLTKKFLTVDGIDSEGNDDIRQKRKESINRINQLVRVLESKVAGKVESSITDRVENASTLRETADYNQVCSLSFDFM